MLSVIKKNKKLKLMRLAQAKTLDGPEIEKVLDEYLNAYKEELKTKTAEGFANGDLRPHEAGKLMKLIDSVK